MVLEIVGLWIQIPVFLTNTNFNKVPSLSVNYHAKGCISKFRILFDKYETLRLLLNMLNCVILGPSFHIHYREF